MSKSDIQKIKHLSVDLLKKIKERIAQMNHWTDKDETRATVQNLIRDELYMNIPDSMFDQLDHYREVIFEHVYNALQGSGLTVIRRQGCCYTPRRMR